MGNLDKRRGWWQFGRVLTEKLNALREHLKSYGSCVVAYSGGVDSAFLARVAHEALAERCLAALADSPSLPRRELKEAVELAERYGIPLRIIGTQEFSNPSYLANPVTRCYFCKSALFIHLAALAREEHFAVIAYGENATDTGDFRPGAQAAAEFAVRAPLKELGWSKAEIRACSAEMGMPTADKPQMPCLSSRIPYGQGVTLEKLGMIERAEYVLRDLGLRDVRVRHHEYSGVSGGTERLARIEAEDVAMVLEHREKIAAELGKIGYHQVTVDLRGYRRGSLNEGQLLSARGVNQ